MELIRLTEQEQFEQLKPGDVIVVEWNPLAREFKKDKIKVYNIHGINRNNELILDKKTNAYFHIGLYLAGKSTAKEAALVLGS